jgi:uncharacterized membrane protein YhaH (DUF805 family)
MNPMRAFLRAMTRAFQIRGRAGRGEYWGFVLVSLLLYVIGAALWSGGEFRLFLEAYRSGAQGHEVAALLKSAEPSGFRVAVLGAVKAFGGAGGLLAAAVAYVLAMLWYWIAALTVAVRRLHDTGRSGWWIGWPIPLGFLLGLLSAAIPFAAILLIPFGLAALVTSLLVLVFTLLPGAPGPNGFGPGRDGAELEPASRRRPTDLPHVPLQSTEDLRALRLARMRGA